VAKAITNGKEFVSKTDNLTRSNLTISWNVSGSEYIDIKQGKEKIMNEEESTPAQLWQKLPETEGEERAEILIGLARDAVHRENGSEALAFAEEAKNLYKNMGSSASSVALADTIVGIGWALKGLKREKEAAEMLEEAIELQRETHFQFVADTYRRQGHWYTDAKEYELAIKSYLQSLEVDQINREEELLAADLYNIGSCYFKLEKFSESADHFMRASESARKRKALDEICWIERELAECYLMLDLPEVALDCAKKALAIADLRKDNISQCKASFSRGKANLALENYDEAAEDLMQADNIASNTDNWQLMLDIQNEYKNLNIKLEKFDEAAKIEVKIATIQAMLN